MVPRRSRKAGRIIGISDSSVALPRLFTICSLNACEGGRDGSLCTPIGPRTRVIVATHPATETEARDRHHTWRGGVPAVLHGLATGSVYPCRGGRSRVSHRGGW